MKTVRIVEPADLRAFRGEFDMTQAALAAHLGFSQVRVSQIESLCAPLYSYPDLADQLDALRAKLKPPAPEPRKPSLADKRKEQKTREIIENCRQRAAERGETLEAYMTRRASQGAIRGHLTNRDIWAMQEQLAFARAHNLL